MLSRRGPSGRDTGTLVSAAIILLTWTVLIWWRFFMKKVVEEPLDVEGYPLAPPELQLEQVHVFVRHGMLPQTKLSPQRLTRDSSSRYIGERTPVRIRMTDPPASLPARWQMCFAARQFSEAVNLTVPTVPSQRTLWFKKVTEAAEGNTAPGLWHVLSAEYF